MFTTKETNDEPEQNKTQESNTILQSVKYKSILQKDEDKTQSNEIQYSNIDSILEKEKQSNKLETWIKLDKTVKLQKLHAFAEKYGKEHHFPMKEIKSLKQFFIDCLDKNKLKTTKDILYDKETGSILQVPALTLNPTTKAFTLKNIDNKRVSTIKSLTPHRHSEKNPSDNSNEKQEK
jgi:hypothetical protein